MRTSTEGIVSRVSFFIFERKQKDRQRGGLSEIRSGGSSALTTF
jgi:hypothetical protein